MSVEPGTELTEKQRDILEYLRERMETKTYFKSRFIAQDLDMSPKEVGANINQLIEGQTDLTIEKWGESKGTTWRVMK